MCKAAGAAAFKNNLACAWAGNADAQYDIFTRLTHGSGVAANDADAIFWLRRAAMAGLSRAQFILGQYLLKGTKVAADAVEQPTLPTERLSTPWHTAT